MKISHLSIKNFKTFDNEGIAFTFNDLTALVGENSSGKSNILEALDIFFNYSKPKISKGTFHHDDISKTINIEVTFSQLTDNEKKVFKTHLSDSGEELIITQILSLIIDEGEEVSDILEEDYDFEESKHGTKWIAIDGFEWARLESKKPTKTNIKKWWKTDLLIDDLNFKSLFNDQGKEPLPEEYQENVELLWSEHFDKIPKEKIVGDEKVLGWKNILKGSLPKFFYMPAIKKVEEDFKVLKTNPFGEMISWITSNISEEIKNDFQTQTNDVIGGIISKIDSDEDGESKIGFLNERLNSNMESGVDCKLEIRFGQPNINDIVFPTPTLYANDGYLSEIWNKGHGVQRLTMFSFLRTYNDFKKKTNPSDQNIIVAIEEPEIYLHPPLKRATYKLLRDLSKEKDQIVYSTHDSYFVSVEYFDEIRLFRKLFGDKPKTQIYEFSLEDLISLYKNLYNKEIDEKSLRHRFNYICDQSKNEGFFARKVVLTEGETEKYALPIYFLQQGFDVDQERISVITAGSVDNISYLYVIFNEFNIPCYIVFDGDKPKSEISELKNEKKEDAQGKSNRNKEILSLIGATYDDKEFLFPDTDINEKYAVWEFDFEEIFHKPLDEYSTIKGNAKRLYGSDSKPLTGRLIAETLTKDYPEKISPLIGDLIDSIKTCKWTNSCLDI